MRRFLVRQVWLAFGVALGVVVASLAIVLLAAIAERPAEPLGLVPDCPHISCQG